MAKNPKILASLANAALDTLLANADGGFLDIYDGAQPATVATAVTTQVLLASLPMNATAFAAAVAGVATANAITDDASANATGTAAWFRIYKSDHTTGVIDGTVGTGTHDLVVSTTSIVATIIVEVTSLTIALPV
jgi:hypothetical protein